MTNLRSAAAAFDATPVIVSRQALRTAALSLVGGAAAMWVASHVGPVAGARNDVG